MRPWTRMNFRLNKALYFLFSLAPSLVDELKNAKHVISLSMQKVEALYQTLPHLKKLELGDLVRLMRSSSLDRDDSSREQRTLAIARIGKLCYLSCKYRIGILSIDSVADISAAVTLHVVATFYTDLYSPNVIDPQVISVLLYAPPLSQKTRSGSLTAMARHSCQQSMLAIDMQQWLASRGS